MHIACIPFGDTKWNRHTWMRSQWKMLCIHISTHIRANQVSRLKKKKSQTQHLRQIIELLFSNHTQPGIVFVVFRDKNWYELICIKFIVKHSVNTQIPISSSFYPETKLAPVSVHSQTYYVQLQMSKCTHSCKIMLYYQKHFEGKAQLQ